MTTVAYFVFNRPELTRQSWDALRASRPRRLLVVSDGPRPSHIQDAELCSEVQSIVANVDWHCDVKYESAVENLGLRRRITSGLSLAFDLSERVIVLEDDCVAGRDFFRFAEELLARYESSARVIAITGDNFQDGRLRGEASYYFSKFFHCWGWAAWRRSWELYDESLTEWGDFVESDRWRELMPSAREARHWTRLMERVRSGAIETWDYQFQASIWRHQGLVATPNMNLVKNIGFGPHATHTRTERSRESSIENLGTLSHPSHLAADSAADRFTFLHHHRPRASRQLIDRLTSR